MKNLLLCAATALVAAGCLYEVDRPQEITLGSFRVRLVSVADSAGNPTPVVKTCSDQYGGSVPAAVRGTPECRYAITNGDVDFTIHVQAFDTAGNPMPGLNRPVAFNVVPGDLANDYAFRTANLTNGEAQFVVRANHVFSEVRVWVQDAPPAPIFGGGGQPVTEGTPDETALEFPRTFATGLTEPTYFQEPTLQLLQRVDVLDTRSSPFVGQFVSIGRPPAAGPQVVQNCADDPERNGLPLQMVISGIDGSGFWIHDTTACRISETPVPTTTNEPVAQIPEPDGFLPGTYGSVYVYNYSHPDGLDVGDLLWSASGSMQEFTSTTQLVFPAWNIAEKVRLLPPEQWNKWLDQVQIVDLNLRHCLLGTTPYLTDTLCSGQSNRNLKLESLESSLVRISNVKMPRVFPRCDRTGDNEVEFFCAYRDDNDPSQRLWGICPFGPTSSAETAALGEEIQCYIDCTNSLGEYRETVCSEGTSFANFGQITVEMNGPGPAAAGLDETVGRISTLTTSDTAARSVAYPVDSQVRVYCNGPVHHRWGDGTVTATSEDPVLPANTLIEPFVATGLRQLSVLSQSGDPVECQASVNPRTRILTVMKDVAPDLDVECDPNDSDATAAEQCRFLHAARFDIVGHLRQVQPARPRWMVIPRDLDDVCCRPGEGMQCPNPIPQCET